MRTALLITAKDLRQRIRDRSVFLFAIAAPFGLALIFSQLLAGATDFRATYVIADEDGGQLATVFREQVVEPLVDAGVVTLLDAASAAEARDVVERGDANAAFVLPAGFTDAITAGEPASLDVIGAANSGLATEIARSLAQRFSDGVATVELSVATAGRVAGRELTGDEIQAVIEVASAGPAIVMRDVEASLRQLSAPTYFSAAMAALFVFFAAQAGLLSLFEERRQATLARILAGPVAPRSILLGKAIGSVVTAGVAMAVLIAGTTVLLGADWGPPIGVALLVAGIVLSAVGITALVTSFMKTLDGASGANSAVAITLGILGGTFSPTAQSPELMQSVSLLTPHAWFLRGLGDLHGTGAVVADALPAVGVLLAIGAVTGAIGFARVRRLVAVR
jgi:ABC-2 type transport system permease protein